MDMAQKAWGWLRARTKEQRGRRNHEVVLGHKLKSDSPNHLLQMARVCKQIYKKLEVFLRAFYVLLALCFLVGSQVTPWTSWQFVRAKARRLTFTKLVSWSLNPSDCA